MEQIVWLSLGGIALALSAATLFTSLSDILGGLLGGLSWTLWAFGATNVEIYRATDTGIVETSVGYESVALLGAGFALVMYLVMLAGSAKALDVRDERLVETDAGQK